MDRKLQFFADSFMHQSKAFLFYFQSKQLPFCGTAAAFSLILGILGAIIFWSAFQMQGLAEEKKTEEEKVKPILSIAAKIPFANHGIKVDGNLEEWKEFKSLPLPFTKAEKSSVTLCWNKEGLYGALQVKDDSVKADSYAPWEKDCFEIFIQRDGNNPPATDEKSMQLAFAPDPQNKDGKGILKVAYYGPAFSTEDKKIQAQVMWKPIPEGYQLEFLIAAETLQPATMEVGTKLGLNFSLDNDGKPVEQFFCDKNGKKENEPDFWQNPSAWGLIQFEK